MLERYFLKHQTVDRIRACWLGTAIERYVEWLEQEGYAPRNVYRRVPLLCHFARVRRRTRSDFAGAGHDTGRGLRRTLDERTCARRHALWPPGAGSPRRRVIRSTNCSVSSCRTTRGARAPVRPDPFRDEAPGFFAHLREERGLKESSIDHYRHYLNRFAAFLARHQITSLRELSVATLAAFVVDSAPALSRNSRRDLCGTIKVFLRYCHRERLVTVDLSAAVEMPQAYRLAELPRSIGWDEVRQIFAVVDRRSPKGIRDYAILLLLVTYGLRAHEVAALTLDDLDWTRDRLCVPERKAGHWTVYPLASVVGEAIVAYLRQVRPTTADRHLFFRVMAPVQPLRATAIRCQLSWPVSDNYLGRLAADVL